MRPIDTSQTPDGRAGAEATDIDAGAPEGRPDRPTTHVSGSSPGFAVPPGITLPTGGGAIRGIGEKFSANPVTGTGSFTVPIATSPGRSGFAPQLSLGYDSGQGNGPFGLGWSLGLPAITRRTDKMLPIYQDADESDVFILSGAEDLVPILDPDQHWARLVLDEPKWAPGYRVHRYRPRIEGLFSRIERWTHKADGHMHWRSITRDNITSLYGADPTSQIVDPADPTRVFSWLICQSYDDRGNAMIYDYKPEDSTGVSTGAASEASRTEVSRGANRYVKRIRYGNRTPRLPGEDLRLHASADWMFEVVFDYGEHTAAAPTPAEMGPWLCRYDPFSQYRAGFEVRTYRLCQRVLMFHHFPDAPDVGADCLVSSTDLAYVSSRGIPDDARLGNPLVSQPASVTHRGYRRQSTDGYLTRAVPPVEFDYTPVAFHDNVAELSPDAVANLPAGFATPGAHWVDLDGEGISGVLTEQAGTWTYIANLGSGHFAAAQTLPSVPSVRGLGSGSQQLIDLAGTGSLDVVDYTGDLPGFYERTPEGAWDSFTPFPSLPHLRWDDPNLRFLDLDGDGFPDVLITEADALTWYPSLAKDGFGQANRTRTTADEDTGPRVVFADPDQSLAVADMSGDGLADLVRIRNGEVCYWPNLGQGRFGTKITMDAAPRFDSTESFDQRLLQLADVDGSGTTDLIYRGRGSTRIWLNQAGNSFTDPTQLLSSPPTDGLSAVSVTDLLGTGTPCLVWSSPLPADRPRPMRYVDLMGGVKPYLLVGMRNNLGAETRLTYTSSTAFYLRDKDVGTPWVTKLPFPVQVLERVEIIDRISRNRFVSRYRYHHGYFDGIEREFRGFGMVEQWDTDDIGALTDVDPAGDLAAAVSNEDPAHNLPPVWTKTWFHTGAFSAADRISRQFATEYYRESDPGTGVVGLTDAQADAMRLDDTVLPRSVLQSDGSRTPFALAVPEAREAARALKGSILRHEIYALDGSDAQARPYQVSESNYTLELLQPLSTNRHAVCVAHPRETLTFAYERALYDVTGPDGTVSRLADPRVTHEVTLDVDGYGNVLRSVAIAYPRRHPDPLPDLDAATRTALQADQAQLLATQTDDIYTNPIDDGVSYRAPLPAETRGFELIHIQPARTDPAITNLFTFDELTAQASAAGDGGHDLPYEDVDHAGATTPAPYRRLLHHNRTLYRRDDLTGALPLGQLQPRGLTYAEYTLAFTPGLLTQVYQSNRNGALTNLLPDPVGVLGGEGGYLRSDLAAAGLFPADDPPEHWWAPSGQLAYSPTPSDSPPQELAVATAHFFLPRRFTDPFGQTTTTTYDPHDLLLTDVQDPLQNRSTVGTRQSDGTISADGHDYRVLKPWLVSDPNRNQQAVAYDTLGMVVGTAVMGKPETPEGDTLAGFAADLTDTAVADYLASPTTDPQALLAGATTRIIYDLAAYQRTSATPDPQPAVAATLARETHVTDLAPGTQTRVLHTLAYSDGFGRDIQHKTYAAPGPLTDDGPVLDPRWVGSGWTIYNNKGKPVRRYEPFFTSTSSFEYAYRVGVSSVLFYDPIDRVVATWKPDDTYSKVVFDAWAQTTWDANDTVLLDPRADTDVATLMTTYLATLPDQHTWYTRRNAGGLGPDEQDAAAKTTMHAATPTIAFHDTLGRRTLTVHHNRTPADGAAGPLDERYPTRTFLDIEGNHLGVIDALGRTASRTTFGPGQRPLMATSADAGSTTTVPDVTSKSLRIFDSRGYTTRLTFDLLRRPLRTYVRLATDPEILRELNVYGESLPTASAEEANLRMQPYRQLDGAGVMTTSRYDISRNLTESHRRIATSYTEQLDWTAYDTSTDQQLATTLIETVLAPTDYPTFYSYNAFNLVATTTTPDRSVAKNAYDEAGRLQAVAVQIEGTDNAGGPVWTPYVMAITYNARGQRNSITTGNNVTTTYSYDPLTFRLTQLSTRRDGATYPGDCTDPNGLPCGVQNLQYTCDPSGNITRVADTAQQRVFFNNSVVDPSNDFTYDALYRLVVTGGREHIGQVATPQPTWDDVARISLPLPGDGQALRRYTETYTYDAVGNMEQLAHTAINGSWTRSFQYSETSAVDPSQMCNRLTSSTVSNIIEHFAYDTHGNVVAMPYPSRIAWDDRNRLQSADLGGGGTVYHAYDRSGQRLRKVAVNQNGSRQYEHIYLESFEVHREFDGGGTAVSREWQTIRIFDQKVSVAMTERLTVGTDPDPAQNDRYQYTDHLGSSCLELDGHALLISYEEYYPYGSTAYQAIGQTARPKRYRYTGKERDVETGFAYHGARYYIPWLARWSSTDPVESNSISNLYIYANCNPVNLHDPDGASARSWIDRVVGVLQAVGGAAEIAAGIAGLGAPTGVTQVLGVIAIAHGADTAVAGLKAAWTGTAQKSYTQRAATASAVALGASQGSAEKIGMGADMAAGILPGAGIGLLRASTAKLAGEGGAQIASHAAPEAGAQVAPEAAAHIEPAATAAEGGFVQIPGQTTVAASPEEVELFERSVKFQSELSESIRDGEKVTKAGTATEVKIPKGPSVTSTLHTHPTSGTALLSEGDVKAFAVEGNYSGDTVHSVLGYKWPTTRRMMIAEGLESPPADVVKTTIRQHMLTNVKVPTN